MKLMKLKDYELFSLVNYFSVSGVIFKKYYVNTLRSDISTRVKQ